MEVMRAEISEKEKNVYISNKLAQSRLPDKTNEVTNLTYNLDVYQQKIILMLISQVMKEDLEFKPVTISYYQLCKLMDIPAGGKTYDKLWESIKKLASATFEIDGFHYNNRNQKKRMQAIFHWVKEAYNFPDENLVRLQLDDSMKPLILNLDENSKYTIYQLGCGLALKKKWSNPLYMLLKSHQGHRQIKFKIETLRAKILGDSKMYNLDRDFMRRVIEPSVEEINICTDIHVSYNIETKERKNGGWNQISAIEFNIIPKTRDEFLEIKRKIWGYSEEDIKSVEETLKKRKLIEKENNK